MAVLSVLLAYLIGSISTSTILSKWVAHLDIREHGSGNAGATNTLRVLGIKWGVTVLAIDIVKGVIAVLLASAIGNHHLWVTYAAGIAVICGHNWPVFFGFRGGKGIATTIGVLLVLMFLPSIVAGVVALVMVAITRYVSVGALTFTILCVLFAAVIDHRSAEVILAFFIASLSVYRHRANIVRLIQGQESRIFSRNI